ncbi:phospholipase D family protein [Pengzhenrongella phosphoraccumulans]|uniref:phospholipase D family protein n=1 Tax=Pengzhenrongella phosphoraccumulans TaxID=3114394 RepID=UPI00388DAEB5
MNEKDVATAIAPESCPVDDGDAVELSRWFLTAAERGNRSSALDRRHADGAAWSTGNAVQALVHGATYFRELLDAVEAMRAGDRLLFTVWRGDRDQLLAGPGTEVGTVFAAAARRGVDVRGLVWRSHSDRFQFSATGNRQLSEQITAAGGEVLLDMRVRRLGSHHQKLVVLRHPDRPERDVAFIGGIDLCHGRRDDRHHFGDPQSQQMATTYGARPPWHDVQLAVRGPAVGDAETVFRERWADPAALSRNPINVVAARLRGERQHGRPLPAQLPDPTARGSQAVQLLRTYPARHPGYPFAPTGEMSIARGYRKALAHAHSLIYVEDQYLWSANVARAFADALARDPALHLIVVIPAAPEQSGRIAAPPSLRGREPAMRLLRAAGGDRVAIYSLENDAGTPIYVHAKICVIDDTWSCTGSDNANRRSWTHDSELSCAVLDDASAAGAAGSLPTAVALRLELSREHLGLDDDAVGVPDLDDDASGTPDLLDPVLAFEAFARTAARLDAWHAGGRRGPRPPGQLRRYTQEPLSWSTRLWASPLYRVLYDPDGRTLRMRRARRF